jgi:hypothetical protein
MTTAMKLNWCAVSLMGFLLTPVMANDAVSTLNFKVEGLFGNREGETAQFFGGSAAIPVGKSFGVQVDGLAGRIDPTDIYGGGLHAFWRDSKTGLVGLTASYGDADSYEVTRVGGEGEVYFKHFTARGIIGHQTGDIEDSAYGGLQGQYYLLDDLVLSAGAMVSDKEGLYAFSAEYQTPIQGLTCFASVAKGEYHYDYAFVGLRFYFGGEHKTLIRRHREDNVANGLFEGFLGIRAGMTSGGAGADPCEPEPEV